MPLCPPEFLSKDIFVLPNGISRSSWTIISMEYGIWNMEHSFLTASPDLFTYVCGLANMTAVFSILVFDTREFDFLSNSQPEAGPPPAEKLVFPALSEVEGLAK